MTQLTLKNAATSQALKEQGLAAVEVNQENFLKIMRATARRISEESGMVSTDNLRLIAQAMGLVPYSPHAWGAVFAQHGWKEIGRRKSAFPGNHAREIRIWRWAPEHQD